EVVLDLGGALDRTHHQSNFVQKKGFTLTVEPSPVSYLEPNSCASGLQSTRLPSLSGTREVDEGCISELDLSMLVTGNHELLSCSVTEIRSHLVSCFSCRSNQLALQATFDRFMRGIFRG